MVITRLRPFTRVISPSRRPNLRTQLRAKEQLWRCAVLPGRLEPVLQRPAARLRAGPPGVGRGWRPGGALSVDDLETTAALVAKHQLTFPVGYGADAAAIAARTGAFVNPEPVYLLSTGFVLASNACQTPLVAPCKTTERSRANSPASSSEAGNGPRARRRLSRC